MKLKGCRKCRSKAIEIYRYFLSPYMGNKYCPTCGQEMPKVNTWMTGKHKEGFLTGEKHTEKGCGGNIIKYGQCSWCDKCDEMFCGCAYG